ncbi:uncharacterized protein ABDE67_021812 [Symphorus nematophorus]
MDVSMNQCEDSEEGVPPSKSSLCGEHGSQTKAQSPEQQHTAASPGPEPSCVSFKSDQSKEPPLLFKRQALSMSQALPELDCHESDPESEPSSVSFKSKKSMESPLFFKRRSLIQSLQKERRRRFK